MNELALFAGAGGGLLASHLLGWNTICAVEYNENARRVLCARQNDGSLQSFPIWNDVRTFDGREWEGIVDIVSGGFPCQAFSTAASGRNNADDLWPEMRRIISDVTPRFVYAENVSPKAINAAADDLESMGYKTRALSLSAKDMGADHIRSRHWVLAYTDDPRELLCSIHAETSGLQSLQTSVWSSYPGESGMVNGMAPRVDRIRASGNGQVPIVAASALIQIILQID